jgi:hypothetical protein
MILEARKYWHTVTWNAIRELAKEGKLRTAKYPPRGIFPVWVYEHNLRLYDIREEIDKRYRPLYSKFIDTSSSMGRFYEGIIEKALTDAGFITLSRNEDTKYFRGREYEGRRDLDLIAYKEGVFYGVEVKNLIAYPNWNDDIVEKSSLRITTAYSLCL